MHALVAHIDILGFREMINLAEKTSKTEELFFKIESTLSTLNDYKNEKFIIKQFSDNICISCDFSGHGPDLVNFISNISSIQLHFATDYGIFVRGGVTVGNHFQSDNTIVSPAYIEAYFLETQLAKYPRIITHPKLTKQFYSITKTMAEKSPLLGFYQNLLIDTVDGTHWINYLIWPLLNFTMAIRNSESLLGFWSENKHWLIRHRDKLKIEVCKNLDHLDSLQSIAIAQKHYWLIHQHNRACELYSEVFEQVMSNFGKDFSDSLKIEMEFSTWKIDRQPLWSSYK